MLSGPLRAILPEAQERGCGADLAGPAAPAQEPRATGRDPAGAGAGAPPDQPGKEGTTKKYKNYTQEEVRARAEPGCRPARPVAALVRLVGAALCALFRRLSPATGRERAASRPSARREPTAERRMAISAETLSLRPGQRP